MTPLNRMPEGCRWRPATAGAFPLPLGVHVPGVPQPTAGLGKAHPWNVLELGPRSGAGLQLLRAPAFPLHLSRCGIRRPTPRAAIATRSERPRRWQKVFRCGWMFSLGTQKVCVWGLSPEGGMVQKSSVLLSSQQGRTRWPGRARMERHRGFPCPFHSGKSIQHPKRS